MPSALSFPTKLDGFAYRLLRNQIASTRLVAQLVMAYVCTLWT